MGTYMDKETLEAEAKRLGVNLDGLSWPQKQKAIFDAKREEGESIQYGKTTEKKAVKVIAIRDVLAESQAIMQNLTNSKLLISPEIKPTQYQFFKYDEEIGNEILVEEANYGRDDMTRVGKDLVTGTYKIVGKSNSKVIAQSTIPKENAEIFWTSDPEYWFPIVKSNGRMGYLFNHARLPHVKDALMKSGYWLEYKDQFKEEPNVWYAAGKQLVSDIAFTNAVMDEIMRKEEEKRRLRG